MEKKLLARRQQAEAKFNDLVKQRDQKEQEIKDIDTELARLQGEFRLVEDLVNKVSPKADVIDVREVEKNNG